MPSKLRKGGNSRYVIYNAQQNDTYTVPHGHVVRDAYIENVSAVQTQTLTVAGGPVGVAATVLTINGVNFLPSTAGAVNNTIAQFVNAITAYQTGLTALKATGWNLYGNPNTGVLTLTSVPGYCLLYTSPSPRD